MSHARSQWEVEEQALRFYNELLETRRKLGEEHKAHDLTKSELKDALDLLRQLVSGEPVCADPFLGEKEPCGSCPLCYAQALLTRLEPE